MKYILFSFEFIFITSLKFIILHIYKVLFSRYITVITYAQQFIFNIYF